MSQTAPRSNPLSHSPHSLFPFSFSVLLRCRHHPVANQIFCSFNKPAAPRPVGPATPSGRRRWIHVTALLTRTNTSFSWRRRRPRGHLSLPLLPFFHHSLHAPCQRGTVKQLDCITDALRRRRNFFFAGRPSESSRPDLLVWNSKPNADGRTEDE